MQEQEVVDNAPDLEHHVQEQDIVVTGPAQEHLLTSTSANATGQPNIFAQVEALKALVLLIDTPGANFNVFNDVKKGLSIFEQALNIKHPEVRFKLRIQMLLINC